MLKAQPGRCYSPREITNREIARIGQDSVSHLGFCYTRVRMNAGAIYRNMNRNTNEMLKGAPENLAGVQLCKARKGIFVTQHDRKAENEVNRDWLDDRSFDIDGAAAQEQGGQFSGESAGVEGLPDDAIEAEQDRAMVNEAVDTINALQVTMDRSGAEHIHAQKTFLTNSGAKSIDGGSSKLTQSGVLQLRADTVELHQSSVVMATSGELRAESGSIIFSSSEKAAVHEGAHVSMLQARSVEAAGNIRAWMLFSRDVKAGGNVETTVDMKTAAVFGAVFGTVFAFLWKLIGRHE